MIELNFQRIVDILQGGLPDEWTKTAFFAMYGDGWYAMKYYVCLDSNVYTDCYELGISEDDIDEVFDALDAEISPAWESLEGEDRWSVFTLLLSEDGTFRAEYDYDEIPEDELEYIENWEKTYLQ